MRFFCPFLIAMLLFINPLFAQTVSEAGRLKVQGCYLLDKSGYAVQLKGMSSHGLQWFGKFANINAMRELKEKWDQRVFRAAMYTEEGGYLANRNLKNKVHEIVRAAIELDIYVIIDWHILSDRNPMWHIYEAKEFFDEMSRTYAGYPNVFYEIANEPNGGDVRWDNAIKPYAKEVVSVIRKNDPEGIIIVGSGTWSQDVQDPANDPILEKNIMYSLHFYAGSHGQYLRDRIPAAMSKGIAIFVTEWGAMDSSGRGGLDYGSTDAWMKLLEKYYVGWTAWSLSDSQDSHAVLRPGSSPNGGWGEGNLSANGKLVKRYMLQ
jgi:endoglucanase